MWFSKVFLLISLVVGFHTITAEDSDENSRDDSKPELAETLMVDKSRCYPGEIMRHDTSCSKYFLCWKGKFIERKCVFGIYNVKAARCEFSNVCRVRTNNIRHSTVVPDCTKVKHKVRYYQHPFDCSKFYKCKKSMLIEKECPRGQQWNQEHNVCDKMSTCEAYRNHRSLDIGDLGIQRRVNIKQKECGDANVPVPDVDEDEDNSSDISV